MTSLSDGFPVVWLKGCKTQEEKDARILLLRNSRQILDLLYNVLADRYDIVERKGFKEEDYAEAGWMFLEAFRNGRRAELKELADLLKGIQ